MSKTPIDRTTANDAAGLGRREFIMAGSALTAAVLVPGAAASAAKTERTAGSLSKVLIINAHQLYPGISEGRLNRTMAGLIREEMEKKGREVRVTSIEQGYTVDEEVQKHLWADIIITQSPVFWFGTPWIYKKYVDEVFTAGLIQKNMLAGDGRTPDDPSRQYGTGGKMQGKKYMLSLTMNAPKEAFDDSNQVLHEGRSVDDLFASNTANYKFCGAEIVPSFACFNVIKAPDVGGDTERLKQHLARAFG